MSFSYRKIVLLLFFGISMFEFSLSIAGGKFLTDVEFLRLINSDIYKKIIENSLTRGDTVGALISLSNYFIYRSNPRYFFTREEVASKVRKFAEEYQEEIEKLKIWADMIVDLYGYDVDWINSGRNRRGEVHSPATVRFLARQEFSIAFAILYRVTGDIKYLKFLLSQIRDFINDYNENRVERGANDVFEPFYAGHRVRNWLFVYNLILDSRDFTWEDNIFMIKVFLLHADNIYDKVRKFRWGNHQLHGLEGLYEVALMFPEFSPMVKYKEHAFKLIMEHIVKEITDDGFQFERSSHYHLLDIVNYFRVYKLSQLNGVDLPEVYINKFKKMFDVIVYLGFPDGKFPVLQDVNDSTSLYETNVKDVMALGTLLFSEPTYKYFASEKFPASFYWFFKSAEIERYYRIKKVRPELSSLGLVSTGYYVMRGGVQGRELYLLIDGGLAKVKPDHTHGGVLGVVGWVFGEQILPNYVVNYTSSDYKVFKNSLVKNVAIVDSFLQGRGWRENRARTGFGVWDSLPQPLVLEWVTLPGYDYFEGQHDGFKGLNINYRRGILFVKPSYWMFMDEFTGDSISVREFRQIWQVRGKVGIDEAGCNVKVVLDSGVTYWICQIDSGDYNVRIWNYKFVRSLFFERRGKGKFLTLIYPGEEKPNIQLENGESYKRITVKFRDRVDDIYLAGCCGIKSGEVSSDTKILVLRHSGGNFDEIFAVGCRDLWLDKVGIRFDHRVNFVMKKVGDQYEVMIDRVDGKKIEVNFYKKDAEGRYKVMNKKVSGGEVLSF